MARSRKSTPNYVSVSDEGWEAAATVIREEAVECLDCLVEKGCDRSFLIACLRAIAWAGLPRISKKEIEKAVQNLRTAAGWVRRLEGSDLGYRIRVGTPGALIDLETDLQDLSSVVEQNVPLADKRTAHTRDDCLAALVRHVLQNVKGPRDSEVSTLVAAAAEIELGLWRKLMRGVPSSQWANRPDPAVVARSSRYSAGAQEKWRGRNADRLAKETVFEREWRARAKASPWRAWLEGNRTAPTQQFVVNVFKDAVSGSSDDLKET